MNKENDTKRKQIIRKIAVIFFGVLLILTFFSNTIMNYSLPEVATASVSEGNVTNMVRVQGAVEMNADYDVSVSGTRVIKEVLVEEGDMVTKGQVLFTFEEGENPELNEAEDTLDQLELEYAKSLLKLTPDYEADNENIKDAKEDLQDAIEKRDAAKENDKKLKAAKKEATAAKKKVDDQQKKVDNLQEKADAYAEIGDYDTVKATIAEQEKALAALKVALADLEEDLKEYEKNPTDNKDMITAQKRAIRDKKTEIADVEANITTQKAILESLAPSVENGKKLKEAQKLLATYQQAYAKKEEKVEALSEGLSLEEAKALVEEKKKALEQLVRELETRKEQDSLDTKMEALDQQALTEDIEEQKTLIEELKNSGDLKQVKALYDGMVFQLSCKTGDTVTADMPLAMIQMTESGYVVNAIITTAQAQLLKVGDTAVVENVWQEDVTASVKNLRANPDNPNQSMLVAFSIQGNVVPGSTLQLCAGEKSEYYDAIVPNNAIKEDSNGKFVLVVTVKGTPLGNRYHIRRVSVEVLASDEHNSAVAGDVSNHENVVTNASAPLESGMQVRLAD